jgi:rhomboid family GlyGly-CTERM serine protease
VHYRRHDRVRWLIPDVRAAERFALAGIAVVLLLQAADLGPALEYRRALLATEPWRLLTGHLVHANWRHAVLNALAWYALARLYAPELPPARQAALLASSALGTSLLLWLAAPQVAWYRGLSASLHGLFAAGAVLGLEPAAKPLTAGVPLWPALLLGAVWAKVLAEQVVGASMTSPSWLGVAVVSQSHLFGAGVGTLIAVLWLLLRRQTQRSA